MKTTLKQIKQELKVCAVRITDIANCLIQEKDVPYLCLVLKELTARLTQAHTNLKNL